MTRQALFRKWSVYALALLPIWLYRGRQGCRKTWFQYACYAFYPLHMLILVQIQRWMLG